MADEDGELSDAGAAFRALSAEAKRALLTENMLTDEEYELFTSPKRARMSKAQALKQLAVAARVQDYVGDMEACLASVRKLVERAAASGPEGIADPVQIIADYVPNRDVIAHALALALPSRRAPRFDTVTNMIADPRLDVSKPDLTRHTLAKVGTAEAMHRLGTYFQAPGGLGAGIVGAVCKIDAAVSKQKVDGFSWARARAAYCGPGLPLEGAATRRVELVSESTTDDDFDAFVRHVVSGGPEEVHVHVRVPRNSIWYSDSSDRIRGWLSLIEPSTTKMVVVWNTTCSNQYEKASQKPSAEYFFQHWPPISASVKKDQCRVEGIVTYKKSADPDAAAHISLVELGHSMCFDTRLELVEAQDTGNPGCNTARATGACGARCSIVLARCVPNFEKQKLLVSGRFEVERTKYDTGDVVREITVVPMR